MILLFVERRKLFRFAGFANKHGNIRGIRLESQKRQTLLPRVDQQYGCYDNYNGNQDEY